MSNVVSRSDISLLTTNEINALVNLTALATSGVGEAITKTGANTFANVSIGSGILSMTTAQRQALSPTGCIIVFDTDLGALCIYTGSIWGQVTLTPA